MLKLRTVSSLLVFVSIWSAILLNAAISQKPEMAWAAPLSFYTPLQVPGGTWGVDPKSKEEITLPVQQEFTPADALPSERKDPIIEEDPTESKRRAALQPEEDNENEDGYHVISSGSSELLDSYHADLTNAEGDHLEQQHIQALYYALFNKQAPQSMPKELKDPSKPWILGKNIMERITTATDSNYRSLEADFCSNYKEALRSFVALHWYWYTQATMQGKPYIEASFQFAGSPVKYLYRFLTRIKTIQEAERSKIRGVLTTQTRVSSHITEIPGPEEGIDIPGSFRGDFLFKLPQDKLHCFFKRINETHLFVKPEDHGTTNYTDIAHHTVGYGLSVARKFTGGNEELGYYKERMPSQVTKLLKMFLNVTVKARSVGWFDYLIGNSQKALIDKYVKSAPFMYQIPPLIKGVSDQYKIDHGIDSDSEITDETYVRSLAALNSELSHYDSLAIRIGNEIIFNLDARRD